MAAGRNLLHRNRFGTEFERLKVEGSALDLSREMGPQGVASTWSHGRTETIRLAPACVGALRGRGMTRYPERSNASAKAQSFLK